MRPLIGSFTTRRATRACSLVLQLALLAGMAPPSAAAAALRPVPLNASPSVEQMVTMEPPPCSRYDERRVFLEVQAWWKGRNTPDGRAHLHAGTCFPLGQTVRGRIRFDVRIIMHNNPGRLFSVSLGVYGGEDKYVKLDHRCAHTCTYWVTRWIDTRTTLDGWHEFRFKPRVRLSNGNRMLTSTGWPARIDNGRRVGDHDRSSIGNLVGRGWYEKLGYQNPTFENARVALRGWQRGMWQPPVHLDAGAKGLRPTLVAAYVDSDFHVGDPGMIVLQRKRRWEGSLHVDTTELSNGWHRLILRVSAKHNRRENTGIQVIWFKVSN